MLASSPRTSSRPPVPALGFFLFSLAALLPYNQYSSAQVTQSNQSSGSSSYFRYQINSTFGTSTSVNANANVEASADAVLNLKPNSYVSNEFGGSGGKASAVFTATPNGTNLDLTGVKAQNMLIIDQGTSFRSTARTINNPNPALQSVGSSSATGSHTSTLTVEQGSNSFTNTLQQAF